jgi:ppGpp synthetase/RelA/SpoT-type nucleotidyltranferase
MFTSLKRYPLISLYQQKKDQTYRPFANMLQALLENLLANTEIHIHQISARVKSVTSLAEKFEKKNYKYDALTEITDLIGLRVITYLETDVDKVFDVLKSNLEIDERNSVDKRIKQSTSQFGYQSLHIVARLSGTRSSLPEYSAYRHIPFEIQVRSILQHSWAEIEHDINYKALNSLPSELSRKLHRAAALLEQADEVFSEIGRELVLTSTVDSSIGECRPATVLDPKILGILLNKDPFLLKLQRMLDMLNDSGLSGSDDPEHILEMRIVDLNAVGIRTIKELRLAIQENEQHLFEFMALSMGKVIKPDGAGEYFRSACLTFLCEFILGKASNYRQVLRHITGRNGSPAENFEKEMAKKIIKDVAKIIGRNREDQ